MVVAAPRRASRRPSSRCKTDFTNQSLSEGPVLRPLSRTLLNVAVELKGRVILAGESAPGTPVTVVAKDTRFVIIAESGIVGDWDVKDIGISARNEGFVLKIRGEQLVLTTNDDAAFADELGLATLSPRLARKVAARHNPIERELPAEPEQLPSYVGAIGMALAGALVILGGTFLRDGREPGSPTNLFDTPQAPDFWVAFVLGGVLMLVAAYVMSIGWRPARAVAIGLVLTLLALFALSASRSDTGSERITAYGFIAGGLVIAVAVLVTGGQRDSS